MAVSNREIINRRAKFEYHFVQEFEAGMVLTGTEVKSIRAGNANLTDAYCVFQGDHLWVKNMYIAEYDQGTIYNHETRRDRILLLKKAELKKIRRKLDEKSMTLIPYKMYFSDRDFVKVQIVVAQGKKMYDKREDLKEKDVKRELDRVKKIHAQRK
ncbi:MAG TPA: SsrA-binding protein SmpB [Saprospiraceae bacterium]|nr:SsrA-binding protein SmpB [Saprospiraceae bacterium]HRG22389.1 SsrA-binding protein SmpB [Saprospiraceae bacterium]